MISHKRTVELDEPCDKLVFAQMKWIVQVIGDSSGFERVSLKLSRFLWIVNYIWN